MERVRGLVARITLVWLHPIGLCISERCIDYCGWTSSTSDGLCDFSNFLHLSVPPFPPMCNNNSSTYLIGCCQDEVRRQHGKAVRTQGLAQSKC